MYWITKKKKTCLAGFKQFTLYLQSCNKINPVFPHAPFLTLVKCQFFTGCKETQNTNVFIYRNHSPKGPWWCGGQHFYLTGKRLWVQTCWPTGALLCGAFLCFFPSLCEFPLVSTKSLKTWDNWLLSIRLFWLTPHKDQRFLDFLDILVSSDCWSHGPQRALQILHFILPVKNKIEFQNIRWSAELLSAWEENRAPEFACHDKKGLIALDLAIKLENLLRKCHHARELSCLSWFLSLP